ncbi:50S ribosomal protein L13 [Candidatus Nomurabacteria bacterium RIFCSPLOWO2_01_FULL_36_10b]|uniref:Large ribosomal subunit protein uL13 n=1 Tax=Candidatus Nomurabacteria bacterium RIFCSPLOWO2_01_FULL_36_10b TaxID=1801766 RepID=A0A1F6WPA3_9BACT|nr:MAG: 50S ribosomal protein L13 [Candidatus Nomurabacteria bacterium RIFCSPLOWO2_01_FULL_36_10b]
MAHYTIDATNKKIGRLATEVADLLRGKNLPDYTPYLKPNHTVAIINASKLDIDDSKLEHIYITYSGYPGGLKKETRGHMLERLGYTRILQHAVRGMLPDNRLRDDMLKHLSITD